MKHGLMSCNIKLMAGTPVPFGYLKYFLMPSVGNLTASGSWQVLPPLILGDYLFPFNNEIDYYQRNTNK
jgi:hypothetical protein